MLSSNRRVCGVGRAHTAQLKRGKVVAHPLQCRCGAIKGFVDTPLSANRAVCYCRTCQAFAHFLGREAEILDERGGTEVIQILPKYLTLTQGTEALACMRLTQKGLHRWYAGCCKTPIGNTLGNFKISFVGLVHTCLETPNRTLQDSFGPIRAWVNTKGAKGSPKPKTAGVGRTILWFIAATTKARMEGSYRHTPFFRADTGAPIVTPRALSSAELTSVMSAVNAAREDLR